MKFPKNLGQGFSGLARSKANMLDLNPVPFLKHRLADGSYAEKKGEFLYAHAAPTPQNLLYPPLLGVYRLNDTNPVNARLKTAAGQRTVPRMAPAMQLVEGQAMPMPASSVYVGDGYVLRLMFARRAASAEGAWIWPVLHKVGNNTPEVLSLSAENVPGANVSFADVAGLPLPVLFNSVIGAGGLSYQSAEPERWPSIYPMGHDGDSYKFGVFIGGQFGEHLSFVGDTAARQLVATPIGLEVEAQWWFVRMWPVGRGHVAALMQPASTPDNTPPPGPPRLLQTRDFGATWTLDDLPALQPFASYWVDSPAPGDNGLRFIVDGAIGYKTGIVQPIGGGRLALVARGAESTVYPTGGTTGRAKWMFFVSDETGANFVRKAWPLDTIDPASLQGSFERQPFEPAAVMDPVPSLWRTERELSCQHMSAGPGTFFFSMSTELDTDSQRTWMVYTLDYGDTWHESADLPQEALSTFPVGFHPSTFPQVTPRVAAPYVDEDSPGVLYWSSAKQGGTVRVFRTSALFDTFEQVSETTIPGYAPGVPSNREPYYSKPVFVGTRRDAQTFIHPGFPGMFDKEE